MEDVQSQNRLKEKESGGAILSANGFPRDKEIVAVGQRFHQPESKTKEKNLPLSESTQHFMMYQLNVLQRFLVFIIQDSLVADGKNENQTLFSQEETSLAYITRHSKDKQNIREIPFLIRSPPSLLSVSKFCLSLIILGF